MQIHIVDYLLDNVELRKKFSSGVIFDDRFTSFQNVSSEDLDISASMDDDNKTTKNINSTNENRILLNRNSTNVSKLVTNAFPSKF